MKVHSKITAGIFYSFFSSVAGIYLLWRVPLYWNCTFFRYSLHFIKTGHISVNKEWDLLSWMPCQWWTPQCASVARTCKCMMRHLFSCTACSETFYRKKTSLNKWLWHIWMNTETWWPKFVFFTNKFNPKTTFQKATLLDHLELLFRMCCFLYVESWEHRKVGGLFEIVIWVVFYAQI